ncbi:unnamed protein product [Peronospora farinosa]|uniref:GPI transamidase subunit PIG-U n=1 Tax=Peronospora farinosa TaxID=134698 RepID=A0AAV0UGY9_9STRA|nr:unnamed protein product [Peronospora farinosa]CAI5734764.1 unnamed protein product [Peronospora farinosa]
MTLSLVLLLGTCVRGFLFAIPSLHETLSSRPELVTPVSSFYRLEEGVFLYHTTDSPYSGDVYHQPPLLFALLYPVLQFVPLALQYFIRCAVFISVDLLLVMGFARLCARNLKLEEGRHFKIHGREIWLSQVPVSPLFQPKTLPTTAAFIALMNPFSLASSVAMSTVSFTHLAVLYSLVFASEGAVAASMMCVAVGSYLSVYPFFLMLPIMLLLCSAKTDTTTDNKASGVTATLGLKCLVSFGLWLGLLFYLSWSFTGDWTFLEETYVWVAKFSDLTPNIGIFWYFFMEVFDRFIPYFLFVMHLHPVIYVVPIYLRLAHRPQAYACALIGTFSLFQAYPSFGDFGFFLSMLALHPKTIMTIENRFVYVIGLGAATCMLPVMWFLWLFPASGNANFFYNQTLVYQIFSSQIITAFVGATMKRDKDVDKYRMRVLTKLEQAKVEARE